MPSWLTVEPPPAQPIVEEAQALCPNVFLQTRQIEAYRITRGRLPYVLEEAGPPFQGMGYRMDWENWVLPDGLPKHPDTGVLLGTSIVTEDHELGQAVVDFLGGAMAHYTLGTKYTFVVERM